MGSISTPTRVLLSGAVIAFLIVGAGQIVAHNVESELSALDTYPTLRALSNECKKTGGWYDAAAKHFGGVNADNTPIELDATCDKFLRLWNQVEPYSQSAVLESSQLKEWTQYVADWRFPVAAFVLALSALPWLWYFILRRIRELRDAFVGK